LGQAEQVRKQRNHSRTFHGSSTRLLASDAMAAIRMEASIVGNN